MRVSRLSLFSALAAGAVSASNNTNVLGAYIIEFNEKSQDLSAFYKDLLSDGIDVTPRANLSYKLFQGASIDIKNTENAEYLSTAILAKSHVKNIWPVRAIQIPIPKPISIGNRVRARDASGNARRAVENGTDTFTPHVMTQVDKLRAEGITGKGIKIGIVDTGVDWTHPTLGGCFGEGCLIGYGYDLTGDSYDSASPPVADSDPMDSCIGHGTHIAGIIAAQPNYLGFTGAAPDVTIGMFKVSGCAGYTTSDVLLQGINMAFEAGSDIISVSVGDDSNWAGTAEATAVTKIVDAGVPCVVAVGNDGGQGLWDTAAPASGRRVAGVGSVETPDDPYLALRGSYTTSNATEEDFGWLSGTPAFGNVTLSLWSPSGNSSADDDACSSLPDSTPDLSDKIVLVRMPLTSSGCNNDIQATNIAAKGGQYIMFYSRTETPLITRVYVDTIAGIGMTTSTQGAQWIDLLNKSSDITLSITESAFASDFVVIVPSSSHAGTTVSSSWGPTWEVEIKPQFTSPGNFILSTYPVAMGSYAVIGGTSMATPLVAAIYALIAQARGTLDPSTLERLVSATAMPLLWQDGSKTYEKLAPIAQQGAGLVQAYDAVHTTTLLSVPSISFNDTDNFLGTYSFSVENTATEDVTYVLGHSVAETMYSFTANSSILSAAKFPNPTASDWATLTFLTPNITIPAGQSSSVTFSVLPPQTLNNTLLPIYSGYVTLNGTGPNNDSLSLPYLGVAGSLKDTPVIQAGYGSVYLSSNDGHFLIPVAGNKTFTIPLNSTTTPILPYLIIKLTMGSPLLRADVIALSNTTDLEVTKVAGGVNSLGMLPQLPDSISLVGKESYSALFNGTLSTGKRIPAGSYAFAVSAVRMFGDAGVDADWETVETVPFVLQYS